MELIARQGEREVRIRIERSAEDPDLFDVVVGEQAHRVRWTRVTDSLRSMLLKGNQHEVAVTRSRDGRYAVSTHGEQVAIEVVDPLTALLEKGAATSGRRRTQQILAYMPGRVVSVLVEQGSRVEPGQSLAVLEAMKMQNEILAEHAGVVKKVLVAPGQSVDGGEPMFDME